MEETDETETESQVSPIILSDFAVRLSREYGCYVVVIHPSTQVLISSFRQFTISKIQSLFRLRFTPISIVKSLTKP